MAADNVRQPLRIIVLPGTSFQLPENKNFGRNQPHSDRAVSIIDLLTQLPVRDVDCLTLELAFLSTTWFSAHEPAA